MTVAANFMIAGEAGQGVQSAGIILARTLARGGYRVFADQDFESRIRGGHNFFRIRVSDREVGAVVEPVNILLALNRESIELHRGELVGGGVILYDESRVKDVGHARYLRPLPADQLAEESAGNKIMSNTVALGACLKLVGYAPKLLEDVLRDYFGGKLGAANVRAARAGREYAAANFEKDFPIKLKKLNRKPQMMLNGHEALSLGAIAAGCKFLSAYPMTPASPILEYLAVHADKMGLAVVQPEDEIAAIHMAIGAAYGGVRAMTVTSGSGFCLMAEGLGLSGITETPLVIVNAQRPGPAVGLPTRTEQGDLQFVLSAHHGDFPRVILAPATVADCFEAAVKAFNLAEKYQLPVIILTDHYLANAYATVPTFDVSRVSIDRGELYNGVPAEYQRHAVTVSGVSPRAFPGLSEALVVTDADEHDAAGHLIEDGPTRTAQMDKRLRKLKGVWAEIAPPLRYGPTRAALTLVGWGSTYGALRETVDILQENIKVNLIHFQELWPFPEAAAKMLAGAGRVCCVESNATGQLGRLIRAETGRKIDREILRYDGRPFVPAELAVTIRGGGK